METETVETVSQDSKNMAVIIWIGTIFAGFIPGLVFYIIKKDDPYILSHAKESLNWYITVFAGVIVSYILMLIVIGIPLLIACIICALVFCIKGALSASKGKDFRIPFPIIRLIK